MVSRKNVRHWNTPCLLTDITSLVDIHVQQIIEENKEDNDNDDEELDDGDEENKEDEEFDDFDVKLARKAEILEDIADIKAQRMLLYIILY